MARVVLGAGSEKANCSQAERQGRTFRQVGAPRQNTGREM